MMARIISVDAPIGKILRWLACEPLAAARLTTIPTA
jgi:hypothetical protein